MSPATSQNARRPGWRRRLIVGGLAVAVAAAAATIVGRRAGSDAVAARRALADGRLDQASDALERWLKSAPRSAEAHFLKAHLAWERRDLNAAHGELERARELGYPPDQMDRLLGLLLAAVNQTSQAEPYLWRAYDNSRKPDPEVAEALARIYLGTFRLTDAAAVLDRWIRESPDDARPYLLRTEVELRTSRDPEAAIVSYRAALARDPNLDKARLGLAESLRTNHHNAEAAAEYAAYLARKPEDPLGYLGAGQNALETGDEDRAVRWLDRALALAPGNPAVLAARATIEIRNQRFDAALDYLDRALKADPFNQGNHYQRMVVLSRLGKKAEAGAERHVLEQIRKDQAEFARISDALLASPLDPEVRSAAAVWLMAHGHEEEAIDWANLVLSTRPSDPAMNRLLADHYRKKGELGMANFHEALAAPSTGRERAVP